MDIQLGQWVVWTDECGPLFTRTVIHDPGGVQSSWAVEFLGGWVVHNLNWPGTRVAGHTDPQTCGRWVANSDLRPATQEEVARAQLSQLEGL